MFQEFYLTVGGAPLSKANPMSWLAFQIMDDG